MTGFDPIMVITQFVFGLLVKKWPALKGWPNKLIPVFNLIVAILVKLAETAVTAANAAGADSLVTAAPHSPSFWWQAWRFVWPIILNTLLTTGVFSAGKNVGQAVGVIGSSK